MNTETLWTVEHDTLAIQYLAENKTFAEVGALLDRTRNSVLSRARRKNWFYPGRKVVADSAVVASEAKEYPVPIITEQSYKLPVPEFEGPPKRFVRLEKAREGQCRFIHGEPREQIICGDKVVPGCSWCAHHAQIVFSTVVKPSERSTF